MYYLFRIYFCHVISGAERIQHKRELKAFGWSRALKTPALHSIVLRHIIED